MRQFFKSTRFKVFIGFAVIILVGALTSLALSSSSSPVSSALGTVFIPFQRLATVVSEKIGDITIGSSKEYESEIASLRDKLAESESKLADYDEIQYKLKSYETMLGLKEENPDYSLVYANIIGTDSQDLFSSLIIDKGSSDGISVNDPVVYGSNVVGVIKSVKPTYSVVWTLLNPEVNVGAFESIGRETGYVTTTTELSLDGKYMLSGLKRETAATEGSIVCTSGIGGVYPKGLIIGSVTRILESNIDISCYAEIEPSIRVNDLSEVFIITAFEGQGIEEIAQID